MAVFNFRAAHHLFPTIGVCYAGLAFVFAYLVKEKKTALRKILLSMISIILILQMSYILRLAYIMPGMVIDRNYFTTILKDNTEPGSRIATEANLLLCGTDDRKIMNVGTLIYDILRLSYSFDEIAAAIKPDYIILTEAKKKWSDTDNPGACDFRDYLGKKFYLVKKIENKQFTTLWIYKKKTPIR
jgi:hypothetical protein